MLSVVELKDVAFAVSVEFIEVVSRGFVALIRFPTCLKVPAELKNIVQQGSVRGQ